MRGPFEFEWLDAYCPDDRWYSADDFELEPRVMRTTGWVVHQGGGYMVIAGTYDEAAGYFAQLIAVPVSLFTRPPRDISEHTQLPDSPDPVGDLPRPDPIDRDQARPFQGLPGLGDLPRTILCGD